MRVLGRCALLGAVLLLVPLPFAVATASADDPAPPPTDVAITIDTSPSGIAVDVDGVLYATPYWFVCPQDSMHFVNATNLSGAGSTRYAFSGWTDGAMSLSRSFVCDAVKNFTATYRTEYSILLNTFPADLRLRVGGDLRIAPVGVWCAAGSSLDVAALSPQADLATRRIFMNWSDGGAAAHSIPCTRPGTYVAGFRSQYLIGVATSPFSFFVQVDNGSYPSPYNFWCDEGSFHTVAVTTVQQGPDGEYDFMRWSDGGASSHAIPCARPANYTAWFTVTPTSPEPLTPGVASYWTFALIVLVLVIVLVVVFAVVGALLATRSSRRGPAMAVMLPPPPIGVPARTATGPSGPPQVCPRCGRAAQADWTYCAACGAEFR